MENLALHMFVAWLLAEGLEPTPLINMHYGKGNE